MKIVKREGDTRRDKNHRREKEWKEKSLLTQGSSTVLVFWYRHGDSTPTRLFDTRAFHSQQYLKS
jgi:hypothetical protein